MYGKWIAATVTAVQRIDNSATTFRLPVTISDNEGMHTHDLTQLRWRPAPAPQVAAPAADATGAPVAGPAAGPALSAAADGRTALSARPKSGRPRKASKVARAVQHAAPQAAHHHKPAQVEPKVAADAGGQKPKPAPFDVDAAKAAAHKHALIAMACKWCGTVCHRKNAIRGAKCKSCHTFHSRLSAALTSARLRWEISVITSAVAKQDATFFESEAYHATNARSALVLMLGADWHVPGVHFAARHMPSAPKRAKPDSDSDFDPAHAKAQKAAHADLQQKAHEPAPDPAPLEKQRMAPDAALHTAADATSAQQHAHHGQGGRALGAGPALASAMRNVQSQDAWVLLSQKPQT